MTFAGLLRQPRTEGRLTQEELAEAASLSPRSVSDLERGINRTAHKNTALLLADALSLGGPMRALFVAAARGRAPAAEVLAARQAEAPRAFAAAATRTLPRDIAAFTGRQAELAQLMGPLAATVAGGARARWHRWRPRFVDTPEHAPGARNRKQQRRAQQFAARRRKQPATGGAQARRKTKPAAQVSAVDDDPEGVIGGLHHRRGRERSGADAPWILLVAVAQR